MRSRPAPARWRLSPRASARRFCWRTARSIAPRSARIVFTDRAARADLEAIVHPDVYRRIGEWFATLPPRHAPGHRRHSAAVRDRPRPRLRSRDRRAPANRGEQLRRLIARDGLSERDARARLDAQWPIEEKEARADYVIRTDGTIADTDAQVTTVYEMLNAEC